MSDIKSDDADRLLAEITSKDVRDDIDIISLFNGLGELSTSAHNNIFGFDHLGLNTNIPYNSDNRGLVFFTRPRMNLGDNNLLLDRVFARLMTTQENTYQRAIRLILDPIRQKVGTKSKLVDEKNAFIPLLSNNLISLTGWPDPTANVYQAPQGIEKESWSMYDDVVGVNDNFVLNANFRNIAGDPITLLIFLWMRYGNLVYDGLFMPHMDSVIENEIDYQTRIYRFVLDPSRQYVQKVAACRAAFPTATSIARAFDYSNDRPITEESASQISVPFQCSGGADYMDPITFEEFNTITQIFNPDMLDDVRTTRMKLLSMKESAAFKHHVYPRVDLLTNRFEWWTPKDYYEEVKGMNFKSTGGMIQYNPTSTPETPSKAHFESTGETLTPPSSAFRRYLRPKGD